MFIVSCLILFFNQCIHVSNVFFIFFDKKWYLYVTIVFGIILFIASVFMFIFKLYFEWKHMEWSGRGRNFLLNFKWINFIACLNSFISEAALSILYLLEISHPKLLMTTCWYVLLFFYRSFDFWAKGEVCVCLQSCCKY